MSEIKYVSPSALAHYDEKIKKVITEIETGSDSKVTQTPTTSNEEYSLLLSPSGQTEETNTTSYFNSDVVLNPSTKTISANIDGNAKTATSADKLNANAGSATQPAYFADGIPKACTYKLEKSVPADAVFTDTIYTVRTSMTALGFTKNSTYTVAEFLEKLMEKNYASHIRVDFYYANNETAKVSDGTTTIDMNGVSCFVDLSNNTYRKMHASVLGDGKQYLMYAQYDNASTPSDQRIIDVSSTVATSCTGNSATATKATQDGDGNVITDTYAEKETIVLKSATGTNISITESKEAPMILNYAPVNLLPNTYNTITDNGITFTVNADGSITVNGTATAQARIYFQSNLKFDFDTIISCKGSGGNVKVYSDLFGGLFAYRKVSAGESLYAFFAYVDAGVTIDNVTVYPMIEKGDTVHNYVPYTGYNITSSNADGSESTTVSINAKTTFPVTGLKSYDGTTNVSNDYSTNMQLTYATNEAGQGILKEIETKAEINGSNATGDWNINITGNAATATSASNIANNLTTTVSGYSLDARQGAQLLQYMGGVYGNFGTELQSLTVSPEYGSINAYLNSNDNMGNYKILEFDCYLTDAPQYMTTIRVPVDLFVFDKTITLCIQQQGQYMYWNAKRDSSYSIIYTFGGVSSGWSSYTKMSIRLRGLK